MSRKVLVVGGSGVFGTRLVEGLLAASDFDVAVAGRDRGRCEASVAAHGAAHRSRLSVIVLDTGTVTADALQATGAFVVVDAAGPFQGQDLRLARAAIDARMHYLDLADDRDFVARISALDDAARAADVAVLSGASSTPALSNAVLDELTTRWRQVDHVRVAILPGNRAPRGLAVVRSILSYAGQPVRVFLDGAWLSAPGWGMTRRLRVAGLGRRWAALCATPDLDIIPARFDVRRSALFQAGLELGALHLGLSAASLLVRIGALRSLEPLSTLARRAAGLLQRFGTDRGAMLVEACGIDADGCHARAAWTMVAEAGDGPSVPTLPALAAVKAVGDGRLRWRGAGPCVGLLQLKDMEPEFRRLRITTRRETGQILTHPCSRLLSDGTSTVCRRRCGPYTSQGGGMTLRGQARVDGPSGASAAAVARLFGFPPAGGNVPVRVDIDVTDAGERWVRDFGGRRFASRLGRATVPGRVIERFGPFSFDVTLSTGEGILRWHVVAWHLGRIQLPRVLMPVASAEEAEDADGRFHFDVTVALPLGLGRIVRYLGSLTIEAAEPTQQGGHASAPVGAHVGNGR